MSDSARTVWSIWTWFVISLCAILALFAQIPLAVLTWPFDRVRRITGRPLRLAGVVSARLTPLWSFGVHGPPPARRPSRTVVVSNHCSQTDPFLLSHLPWEMKYLSKAVLFRVPLFGWSMRLAGDVAIHRGDRGSTRGAMARCRWYLARGMPILIFPEGTRSETGEMRAFKDGAFRLAIEAGAEILPLAVAGTRRALVKHDWRFGRARARVTIGEPISTEGCTLDDVDRLKAETRERIEALYATIAPLCTA